MKSAPTQDDPALPESHPHKSRPGFARIWRALWYSLDGLRSAWHLESAFRQELILGLILFAIVLVLPASLTQKALLIACVMLVLITELLNSAVETTVDRISLENHRLAKRAKDIGSAAVLLAMANLLLVWLLVLADVFF